MVRVIQATGCAAIILSGLLLSLCVARGLSPDVSADTSPTTLERFQQTGGRSIAGDGGPMPPLIQQAEIFALYLNPPQTSPASSKTRASSSALSASTETVSEQAIVATPIQPPSSSPKFELHGISYYRQDPNQSMALICESEGSRRWVRQGDELGHLIVERIDRDGLVYRDGNAIHVMALASSEAVAQFAQRVSETLPRAQSPEILKTSTPAPPAIRGMRQIPLSRVAAKLGHSLPGQESFGNKGVETE